MGIWEYLIWRAILAGIKVDDNGIQISFCVERLAGSDTFTFYKEPIQGANDAACLLASEGVNIPGFDGSRAYVEMMEVARAE